MPRAIPFLSAKFEDCGFDCRRPTKDQIFCVLEKMQKMGIPVQYRFDLWKVNGFDCFYTPIGKLQFAYCAGAYLTHADFLYEPPNDD